MHTPLLFLSFVLLLAPCVFCQMEISNCSFDLKPRAGAYYISLNSWITQISLVRFNLTCDLVANFTVTGKFSNQPSGQPLFSKVTTINFLGRWNTVGPGSCNCTCSGSMLLSATTNNTCTDSSSLVNPQEYNFCSDIGGIQDYFFGSWNWAMQVDGLQIGRDGQQSGRAATFTNNGQMMPYTSYPGTYWGFGAALLTRNCSLTPPSPSPVTSSGACCDSSCYSWTAGFTQSTTACFIATNAAACAAAGPTYSFKGAGTTCTNDCFGACCCDASSGSTACYTMPPGLSPFACSQTCYAGIWYGDSVITPCGLTPGVCDACPAPAPPPPPTPPPPASVGACCAQSCAGSGTSCLLIDAPLCATISGYTYKGDGTTCSADCLGGCCAGTSNQVCTNALSATACTTAINTYGSGAWYGEGVVISPAYCTGGVCPGCPLGPPPPPSPPTPPPPPTPTPPPRS